MERASTLRSPRFWFLLISGVMVFISVALFSRLELPPAGSGWLAYISGRIVTVLKTLAAWHAVAGLVIIGLLGVIAHIRSRLALILGVLGAVYALCWGVWLVSDMMTGVGINQSVIYHIFSSTEGADYAQFSREVIVATGFLLLAMLILVFSLSVGRGSQRAAAPCSGEGSSRNTSRISVLLSLGCLLVGTGWLMSPWHQDLLALADTYSRLDKEEERKLQALYHVGPRTVNSDKNLVVLYLESVESTYFDESVFPELLPSLSRQRAKAMYFSGIEQTPGTGWTIAGLVNTQCGVPLVTPGAGVNEMGRVQDFLPKAKCLAEHLADNGFHTVYIGGASGEFAGKTRFLKQHGFHVVRDKSDFQDNLEISEGAFSGWGVYDDKLLDSVYQEFIDLSRLGEPFALFSLTMDTHHPHGHISPSCSGMRYGEGNIKTLNALRCADHLVSRFIERITTSPYYQDTTLVVLSDHLAMANDAKELIDSAEKRENLLMVFDDTLEAGERVVRGSMLDVGATLLYLLGADDARLGFGRSLLGPHDGGDKAYSAAYYASGNVTPYLGFARDLWDMPSIVGQIRSDGNGGVLLGNSHVDAPFFSVLDSKNRVVELYFYDFSHRIDALKEGSRYLYTLKCEEARNATSGMCLVSGLKGVGEKIFTPKEFINGIRAADIF